MAKNIGIDLGASTALMYLSENGRIIEEPGNTWPFLKTEMISLRREVRLKHFADVFRERPKIVYPFRSGTDPEHEYFYTLPIYE